MFLRCLTMSPARWHTPIECSLRVCVHEGYMYEQPPSCLMLSSLWKDGVSITSSKRRSSVICPCTRSWICF